MLSRALGPSILWNPASLSYLAEFILAATLAAYLALRLLPLRGRGRPEAATLYLCLTMVGLAGAILCSLLRAQLGGFYFSYAMPWVRADSLPSLLMPWVATFGGVALFAFVQFAYVFPERVGSTLERRTAGGLILAMCAVEAAIAVHSVQETLKGEIWFRAAWMAVWMALASAWAAGVFFRQFRAALNVEHPGPRFGEAARRLFARHLPKAAAAARGYLLIMLLPLLHIAALLIDELIPEAVPIDIFSCWTVLALLWGFATLHLNYRGEESTFMFKMVVVSLVLVLALASGFGWMISAAYSRDFYSYAMVKPGQSLSFTPDGLGGYVIQHGAITPRPAEGQTLSREDGRIDLPFDFPFFGGAQRTMFASPTGALGFTHAPTWIETPLGYGKQPAIYALAASPHETAEAGAPARVTVTSTDDAKVVTWRRTGKGEASVGDYAFRAVLHRDGRIDLDYLQLPSRAAYSLFDPAGAPWCIGLVPGGQAHVQWIDLAQNATIHSTPGAAVIQDYYLEFLRHVDQLYAPLVSLMIASAVAVSLALPLFFRVNLLTPLERLQTGVKRFHDGDLAVQVPVTYPDEIGYVTQSFNAMARSFQTLVASLEDRVTQRVADVRRFEAHNALLQARGRLAADLHDSVSQTLTSSALAADALAAQQHRAAGNASPELERIKQLNRRALEEIRLLTNDLYAQRLADLPLAPLLMELAENFREAHGIEIVTDISGGSILPSEVQLMFFQVAQESLNNVVRHSGATRVEVTFEALAKQAMLSVADNGRGFDPRAVPAGHLGLQIMAYRSRLARGSLDVQTRPGGGAAVTLIWYSDDHA